MTCRRELGGCGHEFCWVCMGPWNSHAIINIDSFYTCNKALIKQLQEEKKKKKKIPEKFKEKFLGKKEDLLQRYINFYQKWDSHKQNLEFAEKLKDKVQKFKKDLR